MYQWYERASVCYAYLSDLPPLVKDEVGFPHCRWFTRGWTLQELLASTNLVFYDSEWGPRSTKHGAAYLISSITGIQSDILWHNGRIKHASVAEKMSWASRRETTRIEDMAYCLLGLFDINMPMLYGERWNAFLRLQYEIVKKTNDLSLFAWMPTPENDLLCGVMATTPSVFQNTGTLTYGSRDSEFNVTNKGVQITTQFRTAITNDHPPHFLLLLGKDGLLNPWYLVLQKVGQDRYVRDNSINSGLWCSETPFNQQFHRTQSTYLIHDPSYSLQSKDLQKRRLGSTRLHLEGNLKVFEVIPESVWDPAHSIILDPSISAALLIGSASAPYGSIWVILLKNRTVEKTFALSASSPAMPYVLKNISQLTDDELARFWNIRPLELNRLLRFGEEHFSHCAIAEGLNVNLTARFWEVYDTERTKVLQLNHLSISSRDDASSPCDPRTMAPSMLHPT